MTSQYLTGYNGTVRTLESLLAWSHWQNLDPEYQRRALAIMDASIVAGRPLGIGSIFRTFDSQLALFLSRHYVVTTGGCCSYDGKRYALRPGMAHAAPPLRSYHEATTPEKKALAIDFIGDLKFLSENQFAYGLREFTNIGNEPWHGQPREIPNARFYYVPSEHAPLKVWPLPGLPEPAPTRVFAPKPVLRQDVVNNVSEARALQLQLNFWGWRDALGRNLIVDGDYGAKTAQAVMTMQKALSQVVDGVYGNATAIALQVFLDAMANLPPVAPVPVPQDQLKSGETLLPGQSRKSADGQTTFIHQTDGNVVLYKGAKALWSSGTAGKKSTALVMQTDGNLVLYSGSTALWDTKTHGNPGALLVVIDAVAFVLGSEWRTLWRTP